MSRNYSVRRRKGIAPTSNLFNEFDDLRFSEQFSGQKQRDYDDYLERKKDAMCMME